MATVQYKLTVKDNFSLQLVDDKLVLTFERDCDDEDVNDADSSGDYQSDLLWELFEHEFTAFHDDGTTIEYCS